MEELQIVNGSRPKELHIIIIWDPLQKEAAEAYLASWFESGKIKRVYSEVRELDAEAEERLFKTLYKKGSSRAIGHRLYMIVIEDQQPIYQSERATSCQQVLNYNMHLIKNDLRKILSELDQHSRRIQLYIHTSYNPEETALALDELLPKQAFLPRPAFRDASHLFEILNSHPRLKYVLMPTHRQLDNDTLQSEGLEVLVNDYYLFKSLVGGKSVDKDNMREVDNGWSTMNHISIGGNEVACNIRYAGDRFVDPNFHNDLLNGRIQIQVSGIPVMVPSARQAYYALLYRTLVHQSKTGADCLPGTVQLFASHYGSQWLPDLLANNGYWDSLYEFMLSNDYCVVQPRDKETMIQVPVPYKKLLQANDTLLSALFPGNPDLEYIQQANKVIFKYIPHNQPFVLIDDYQWAAEYWSNTHTHYAINNCDGEYLGEPGSNKEAIQNMEYFAQKKVSWILLALPCFWWIDCYPEWYRYMCQQYNIIFQSGSLVIFKEKDNHEKKNASTCQILNEVGIF